MTATQRKRSKTQSTLLVGDIGGTRTRLALYDRAGKELLFEAIRSSREHASFDDIALTFLAEAGAAHPAAAVLGVAGPVERGVATVTNLPWKLDERALEKRLLIPRVVLKNDLVVSAEGCLHASPSSVVLLTEPGPAPKGQNMAVIAAGTGLGEARLIWDGSRHLALPSEAGHADFAPRTPLEIELWHFLIGRYPEHVSWERVVSGDGLGALYDFFSSRAGREPRAVARRFGEGDRNAVIAELGLARGYRPAARAVDLFVALYGAEAGNLALRELALGGVFVVGNIARVILPERREIFLDAFRRKGRFSSVVRRIPVSLVTDPLIGVRGALSFARQLVASAQRPAASARSRPPRPDRAAR